MGSLQGMYNFLGKSFGRGTATGGTKTTLLDTKKVFEDDMLNGTVIRMNIGGIDYYRTVTDTTASSSTITFATLPGTPASCAWTVVAGHVITTVSVADGGNDYTITAALAVGNNKPLAVTLVGNVITIALATGAAGASNDVANTAVLVAAAINGLAEFTSSVTTGDGSGVVPATASVAFTGGVDEVKPELGTHYEIAKNDGLSGTKLSGSNAPKSGQKNVTTAGTQVALGTTQVYKELTIIAKDTNTGYIYVGDSTVDATTGMILPKGGYVTFHFVDIADVYIDSSVNGEGVSFGGDI